MFRVELYELFTGSVGTFSFIRSKLPPLNGTLSYSAISIKGTYHVYSLHSICSLPEIREPWMKEIHFIFFIEIYKQIYNKINKYINKYINKFINKFINKYINIVFQFLQKHLLPTSIDDWPWTIKGGVETKIKIKCWQLKDCVTKTTDNSADYSADNSPIYHSYCVQEANYEWLK